MVPKTYTRLVVRMSIMVFTAFAVDRHINSKSEKNIYIFVNVLTECQKKIVGSIIGTTVGCDYVLLHDRSIDLGRFYIFTCSIVRRLKLRFIAVGTLTWLQPKRHGQLHWCSDGVQWFAYAAAAETFAFPLVVRSPRGSIKAHDRRQSAPPVARCHE